MRDSADSDDDELAAGDRGAVAGTIGRLVLWAILLALAGGMALKLLGAIQ